MDLKTIVFINLKNYLNITFIMKKTQSIIKYEKGKLNIG